MDLTQFIPFLLAVLIPLSVGIAAILLYLKRRAIGLLLVAIGFFLFAAPHIRGLVLWLWVSNLITWLFDQGFSGSEINQILWYLWYLDTAIQVGAAILTIVGLVYFSKDHAGVPRVSEST